MRRDFDASRRDLRAFAELAGMPLTSWQADALRLERRLTAICAPRQSGKSRSLALLAVWRAFVRPTTHVLIVSAGEEASRRLLRTVRDIVAGSPVLRGSVVDETTALVTLSNGSQVRSVPASERQIRGWSVDLLLVDEAALVSDDLILGAAIPATAARRDGRVLLASSALMASGTFFDHVMRGDSEHQAVFRWKLADCWWIAPSVIQAARESMSEQRFQAEYQGVFASGADALFPRHVIDAATADYQPATLAELGGPARLLGGVDWGISNDRSALVAVGRLPVPGERVFGIALAHRWPQGAPIPSVIDEIVASGACFDLLTGELNGCGAPACQLLVRKLRERPAACGGGRGGQWRVWDAHELDRYLGGLPHASPARERPSVASASWTTRKALVTTTAPMKAATYAGLRLLMERGMLLIPASAEDVRRELALLRVTVTASGMEHIEAGGGAHDDLADGLMLSASPRRDRAGRWTSRLARLAEAPELPQPASDRFEALWDCQPLVEAPCGVAVPRRPAWQSVCGSEISLPPGVGLSDPATRAFHARIQQSITEQRGDRSWLTA